MKIDTEIRHVTKVGANIFVELGFSEVEAKRLQAKAKREREKAQTPQRRVKRKRSRTAARSGSRKER